MRVKMNDLLKSVKRRDGATPFAVIIKVVETRGWNGESSSAHLSAQCDTAIPHTSNTHLSAKYDAAPNSRC